MSRNTKIQKLINEIDRINYDEHGDMLEFDEACQRLGREIYYKVLREIESTITIKKPKVNRLIK